MYINIMYPERQWKHWKNCQCTNVFEVGQVPHKCFTIIGLYSVSSKLQLQIPSGKRIKSCKNQASSRSKDIQKTRRFKNMNKDKNKKGVVSQYCSPTSKNQAGTGRHRGHSSRGLQRKLDEEQHHQKKRDGPRGNTSYME